MFDNFKLCDADCTEIKQFMVLGALILMDLIILIPICFMGGELTQELLTLMNVITGALIGVLSGKIIFKEN